MAAAGLHIQDQGRLFRMSSGVCQTIKIYTDWANHYLEKAKNKHTISDLQQDVSDGVLLAEVIEAVSKCSYNLCRLR
uniref:Calponin-homology (CH) domain-containing protein n=1 Tax=Magallana gigas TaxID=29159 RepID=A0A8W8JBE2_MAGGI